jgi:hypothetical protein
MVIQNVDRYRVIVPLIEGARVILNHLGEGYIHPRERGGGSS